MHAFKESTTPLMRPNQVVEMKEEVNRLKSTLSAPPHIANQIQDVGEMRRQLKNITSALETQSPKPYGEDLDAAVNHEAFLREELLKGMPTQAEMRRNPAGAVDKHRGWEKRSKAKLLEWKNTRLRLHASGATDDLDDAQDVANFEKFRPADASHELNMHGEQIAGAVQHGPYTDSPSTIFSDADKAALKAIDPEIADSLALMNNDQRAQVKDFMKLVRGGPPKGGWTPERKAEASRKAKERYAQKQED